MIKVYSLTTLTERLMRIWFLNALHTQYEATLTNKLLMKLICLQMR